MQGPTVDYNFEFWLNMYADGYRMMIDNTMIP